MIFLLPVDDDCSRRPFEHILFPRTFYSSLNRSSVTFRTFSKLQLVRETRVSVRLSYGATFAFVTTPSLLNGTNNGNTRRILLKRLRFSDNNRRNVRPPASIVVSITEGPVRLENVSSGRINARYLLPPSFGYKNSRRGVFPSKIP